MATATAWNIVLRSSGAKNRATVSTNRREVRASGLSVRKRQLVSHEGLRVLYNAERLTRARKIRNENSRKVMICECGMNLVFVGAEVGPWSKTGGLGDVLGGLPPAMAVRSYFTLYVLALSIY